MNVLFPNRKALVDHAVSALRRARTRPDASAVKRNLGDYLDEMYGKKEALAEALDRILKWDDPSEEGGGPKWTRFVRDVTREYLKQSKTAAYLNVGDLVYFGKYKNKPGKIVEFGEDAKGNPTVTIEPVPKGRKKNKTMGLFKIWKKQPVKEAVQRVITRHLNNCS